MTVQKQQQYDEWFSGVHLEEKSIVLEVGAFNGTLSKYLSKKYEIEKVYAIESSVSNFKILCDSVNAYKNIIPINVAIGEKDGEISFYEFKNSPNMNSIIEGNSKFNRKTNEYKTSNIQSLKLKTFIEKNKIEKIDLLLLNCEGAEQFILKDIIEDNLRDIVKCISVEFHPHLYGQKTSINLIKRLKGVYNFTITKRNLRGPINVIFFKENKINRKFVLIKYLQIRAGILDFTWPVLRRIKKTLKNE